MESLEEKKKRLSKSFIEKYGVLIIVLIVVVLILLSVYFFVFKGTKQLTACGDGTLFGECSENMPYFCEDGILIEKASVCGCSNILTKKDDSCISDYQKSPKQITLDYILRGEEKKLGILMYGGIVDYISTLSPTITYMDGEEPSKADFKLRNINEPEQRELLLPLVIKIQNLAPYDKIEQARIAVSLVQNIPYGFSDKTTTLPAGIVTNYSRYPYEVLYEGEGVCGEKTELLSFLLKEIGYETAFFYHQYENHESVGVKCPEKYSLSDTGYCFIETTGPSIITDDSIEYVGGITLSLTPEVYKLSDGDSLPSRLYEYRDANTMKKIRQGSFMLFRDSKIEKLRAKYGLVEEYNAG